MLKVFENICCLNLEDRKDRKAQAEAEFNRVGILKRVEFFKAIPGGIVGFNRSMHEIHRYYHGNTMVFEDDVLFVDNVDYEEIDKAIDELPEDWDIIYLGANIQSPQKRYSKRLIRMTDGWTTHAVGYSAKMMEYLRENWDGAYRPPYVYDEWLRKWIQPNFQVFITDPMYCTQRAGWSNIWNRITVYDVILKSQKYYERA